MTTKAKSLLTVAVRRNFANCSTHDSESYYTTKWGGFRAFDEELARYGLTLRQDDNLSMTDANGRLCIDIVDADERYHGTALISWYRMPSGRYEFTGYIA